MIILTNWALRLFGISGVIGAILFIFGDLLYNHVPGSTNSFIVKMSKLPKIPVAQCRYAWINRLLVLFTGVVACVPGISTCGRTFSFIFWLAFAATMIGYGIGHTAYFAIAAGAQVAVREGSDAESGGKLGNAFFQKLIKITYIPVAIFSLMMIYGIITGLSLYPRWMVVFLPIFIYLLKTPVIRILKGHLKEIINDSYDNLVLFIFYVLSTIVLWNGLVS